VLTIHISREFKVNNKLNSVIVLWSANTQRFASLIDGVNDTDMNLLAAIKGNHEVAPSTIYAVASILEGCAFYIGSPQNTFVPGAIMLAEKYQVYIGCDEFETGQTKVPLLRFNALHCNSGTLFSASKSANCFSDLNVLFCCFDNGLY